MTLIYLAVILGVGALLRRWLVKPRPPSGDRETRTRRAVEAIGDMVGSALILAATDTPRGSALGGRPFVPAGFQWPIGHEGPLGFVGQFDLAELHEAGGPPWLPDSGMLLAFHHEDWGCPDLVRIVHTQSAPGDAKARLDAPDGWAYPERAITFERRTSLPSLEWLSIDGTGLAPAGDAWAELSRIADKRPFPEPHHQVGGYPEEIQPDHLPVAAELAWRRQRPDAKPTVNSPREAAMDWRLLLQIDTDDELGMSWMDCGRLYVLIREQDARAGDFSQTVTIVQTY